MIEHLRTHEILPTNEYVNPVGLPWKERCEYYANQARERSTKG